MKIGLFGDSFGYQHSNNKFKSWVDLLSDHANIINYCQCGIGEYKILKQLQNATLTDIDQIIITHTSPSRVFVPYNPLHQDTLSHSNCDIIYADIAERTDSFSIACQKYFKFIFDMDHAKDMHNLICKEISHLCKDKTVVHITHFDYQNLFQFDNMLNFYELWCKNQGPVNHYNQFGNQQIYQTILKKL